MFSGCIDKKHRAVMVKVMLIVDVFVTSRMMEKVLVQGKK